MAVESGAPSGVLGGVAYDLKRLHENWMALVYPRQRESDHEVLEKWTPRTQTGWIAYRLWGLLGAPLVAVAYPFLLAGLVTRFYARRIDRIAASLGLLGVLVVSVVVWGGLTIVAHEQLSTRGFFAVGSAAIVATISAGLGFVFARVGGRGTTVVLAYPSTMNALFLPPVVAALFSETLATMVFPSSYALAEWLLDTVLVVGGLDELLRQYTLEGVAYVGMWFGIAVPVGWLLGVVVLIADLVRPN